MPYFEITAYDKLSAEQQEKIDLAIFGEEIAASQGEPRHPSIELPALPENRASRIEMLQNLYAVDMQSENPTFYAWHVDAAQDREEVRAFIRDIRKNPEISASVHLDELLSLLTNLPGAVLAHAGTFAAREEGRNTDARRR